jgi:hypothetical protein
MKLYPSHRQSTVAFPPMTTIAAWPKMEEVLVHVPALTCVFTFIGSSFIPYKVNSYIQAWLGYLTRLLLEDYEIAPLMSSFSVVLFGRRLLA